MPNKNDLRNLRKLPPDEIISLNAGIYPDYLIVDLLDKEDEAKTSVQKVLALHKLIMRSPELDQSIEYGEVVFELIDYEVNYNSGEDLLYWVLIGLAYISKNHSGLVMYRDYFDYSRGLLYKGYYSNFLEVLKKLVDIGPIAKFQLVDLINDFGRLNQVPIAQRLDELGLKIFGSEWKSESLEKIISEQSSQQGDSSDPIAIDDEIFGVLKEENIDFDPDYEDYNGLISIEALTDLINAKPPIENFLPFVPDMLIFLYQYWEEDRKISYEILRILRDLSGSIMPELSFFGELFNFNRDDVFISETFGKYQGFSVNQLVEFIENENLCYEIRGNAGLMLMDIAQSNPEKRSDIIDILARIIEDPPQDTLEYEALVTNLVADVLDYDLFELKGPIHKAFDENRIDPMVVQSRDFTGDWSLGGVSNERLRSGRPIFLTCKACGRTRRYSFDYLLMDIEQGMSGFGWDAHHLFVDHPVSCSKCGAVDNYEVATNSLIGLLSGLFLSREDLPFTDQFDEEIFFFNIDWIQELGFRNITFGAVRHQVIIGNIDKINPFIMGLYYRTIGRFDKALEIFRNASMNSPEDRKGLILLAAAEHDFGDKDKAKFYYKQVLASSRGDIYLSIDDPVYQKALVGLAKLDEGEHSLFPYPTNIESLSLLEFLESRRKRKRRRH